MDLSKIGNKIKSVFIRQRSQEHIMGKRSFLQQRVLGKLDTHMQKSETGSLSYTIYKNILKMN